MKAQPARRDQKEETMIKSKTKTVESKDKLIKKVQYVLHTKTNQSKHKFTKTIILP